MHQQKRSRMLHEEYTRLILVPFKWTLNNVKEENYRIVIKEVKTEVSGGLVLILLVGRSGIAKATHTQFHRDIQCSPNPNPSRLFYGC